MHAVREAFNAFSWFAIAYMAFVDAVYLLYTVLAFMHVRLHARTSNKERLERIFRSRMVPPVSIILPAYNEVATIADSVRAMPRQLYPQYELVVVNDGSTDATLETLIETFKLERIEKTYTEELPTAPVRGIYASYEYPRLVVIDKENGRSKADAMNAGINAANYPLFCACDADSLLEDDALLQLVLPMLDRAGFVPATGGVVRAANGSRVQRGTLHGLRLPDRPIEVLQIVEYLRAFLTARAAQSTLNVMLIVSGAFGLFNKALVKQVGGYDARSSGEDFELVVRLAKHLHRIGKKFSVVFVPQTVCWTMVPEDYGTLGRQRERWHRGLLETLWWHRDMVLNPRYGLTGTLGLGSFLFIEALGPIVELAGYVLVPIAAALHAVDLFAAALFFFIAVFGGTLLSLSALLLEEMSFHRYTEWRELERLIVYAVLENFGYRQLTLWWRVKAAFTVALRRKAAWGVMRRRSFSS